MKLLIFVTVLVLVAQGKAAPPKDEVKEVQSEEVDGYVVVDAGQEAGGVKFVEEAPAEDEPSVAGAGLPRAYPFQELAAEHNFYAPQTVYIPMVTRACTNSACLQICNLLGFANGICVSVTTCQCF